MSTKSMLERVHRLQQQLHEAIVEDARNERKLNDIRSNTMNVMNSNTGNKMMAMLNSQIHVCDKCASEHHGPCPTECTFCKKSMSFTTVSTLSAASARVAEILAIPDPVMEDGTDEKITIVGPSKIFVPKTVLRKAA